MAERRAEELNAGAELLDRNEAVKMMVTATGMLQIAKVHHNKTGYGYSSLWFSAGLSRGRISIFVDRAADGLYRLKMVLGDSPRLVATTNYVDWPELAELYRFLDEHRAKQGGGR
ncbi:MAG: hypothetical protein AAB731_02875 [Patescibacteria group bacterium]